MNDQLTFKDMIDFILLNRGTTTFMEMDEPTIASQVMAGISHNTLFYSLNPDNKISGMILAEIDHEKKIIFVTENLAMNLTNLRAFARRAKQQWPEYNFGWVKHGNIKSYDSTRVYNKLNV